MDGGDLLAAIEAGIFEGVFSDADGGGTGDDLEAGDDVGDHFVFEAGVEIFSVFAEDDEVDGDVLEAGFDAGEGVDGADVGEEIEFLAEGDVDALEAAGDWGGDGAFESDSGAIEGVNDGVGDGLFCAFDDFAGELDAIPIDGYAGGVDGADSGSGDFGTDAVAGEESDLMGHGFIVGELRWTYVDERSLEQHNQRLGQLFRNLEIKPVEPDSPFYVGIWEGLPYDPVARMRTEIEWSEVESLQLFSGFSGAGKTTQLLRFKKELVDAGYLVVYADAEDYLNLGEPVDISDILYTVAGAFSDGLQEQNVNLPKGESYWERFQHYLTQTKVEIGELTIPTGVAELKAELHMSTTFRQKLQQHLSGHVRELTKQAHAFVEEGLREVRRVHGEGKRVVFLLDSLEKLRATPTNEQEMMNRLEQVFRNYLQNLRFPWIHCVYTVPAWLRKVVANADITLIPSIKLQEGRDSALPSERGWKVLRQLVRLRLGDDGCRLVFGEPNATGSFALADKLIEMSGGAPRDLLRLFREAIRLSRSNALPLDRPLIETAIATVRNEMQVSVRDAHWLDAVARTKAADLPTSEKADVNHYMRMLDNHFILCYRNNSDWYDVHPMIRGEVARIVSNTAIQPK